MSIIKSESNKIGLVFSGGGARAAYQVGCLYALKNHLETQEQNISVVVGTSLGALNGLLFSAALHHGVGTSLDALANLWRVRTFENTFNGSLSRSFIRSLQVTFLKYRSPGPGASSVAIFDPSPLEKEVDQFLDKFGGVRSSNLAKSLSAVGVMSTVEGRNRKPLLLACARDSISRLDDFQFTGASFEVHFASNLRACHGLASAALPSVLPSVELDVDNQKIRLVDGGISDNHPVDPAVRMGANSVMLLDASGRRWWFDHYGTPHDTRPKWELPAAEATYCMFPDSYLDCSNKSPLGTLLKVALGGSTRSFVRALGPVWPIFRILKAKMGEDLAYEVISYVALSPDYTEALFELGKSETLALLKQS